MVTINPLLPKATFAAARGCSVRTIDRMVSQRLIPRGEPINGTALGWRASLVNLSLDELETLARAQSGEGAAEHAARTERMRTIGAKGGRRLKRRAKAQPVSPEAG